MFEQKTSTRQIQVIVILLITLFCIVNVLTLHDGHNWGDDFAQYILHAQNIVNHHPYGDSIMVDLPFNYPPGFPLLLALAFKFFGMNFFAFKTINIICWIFFCLAVYGMAREEFGAEISILLLLFLLASPFFFILKQNILSDIPFVCCLYLAIYFLEKYYTAMMPSPKFLWLGLFWAGYSYCIRTAGISLFLALSLYVIQKKRFRDIFRIILVFVVAEFIRQLFGVRMFQHFNEMTGVYPAVWLSQVKESILIIVENMTRLYVPHTGELVGFLSLKQKAMAKGLLWLVFFCFLFYLAKKIKRKTASLLEIFTAIYFISVISWPITSNGRYELGLVGAIPLLISGFLKKRNKQPALVFILLIFCLFSIGAITKIINFNDDIIFVPPNQDMLNWVKNLGDTQRVMYWKPRLIRLVTGKIGTTPILFDPQENISLRIKKYFINYIILNKNPSDLSLLQKIQSQSSGLQLSLVWQNEFYMIFKIQ